MTTWLVPISAESVDADLRQAARLAWAFAVVDLGLRQPPELVWVEPSRYPGFDGALRAAAIVDGDSETRGVHRRGDGKIWIVASRVRDEADMRRVVWHELAHHHQEETGRCAPIDELGTRYRDRPSEIEARAYEVRAASGYKRAPTPSTAGVREWSLIQASRDAELAAIGQRFARITSRLVGSAATRADERRPGPDATPPCVGSGRQPLDGRR